MRKKKETNKKSHKQQTKKTHDEQLRAAFNQYKSRSSGTWYVNSNILGNESILGPIISEKASKIEINPKSRIKNENYRKIKNYLKRQKRLPGIKDQTVAYIGLFNISFRLRILDIVSRTTEFPN